MILVNMVYDDEELLEPYEWEDNDRYLEFYYLPIFRVTTDVLHDFMYNRLRMKDCEDGVYIISDLHYHFVVEIKNRTITQRGTITLEQREKVRRIAHTLSYTHFQYDILEEAYEKEFGLTRKERMKKMCLEEVIDEIFVVHYDLFLDICKQLDIDQEYPGDQYIALKNKIEKGYSSLHELLYKELVQKG